VLEDGSANRHGSKQVLSAQQPCFTQKQVCLHACCTFEDTCSLAAF